MCGIAGIISQGPMSQSDVAVVSKMNGALVHRGPDGSGEFHDDHVALSVRRLSIIDLAGGSQPLYNEDRSLVLVANGEIYNFVELRAELQKHGHWFRTGSDCETILHLYEEHGIDGVRYLRGMFAFALWDMKRHRLLIARDRMGEKPVYLYERNGHLLFASELKALLQSGMVPFELSSSAVDMFFHYQYVPEPETPIHGVRKLPAAHILSADVDHWEVRETCYWNMEEAPPLEGDPVELIRSELDRVSELIVRSDVPVGVALSGGLDSSAIAALTSRKYRDTMHAFSVGYAGRPPYDERADAKALAQHLRMPFHDVELRTEDMVSCFPQLVGWRDDPIADISGYGYYAVMQLARAHGVPVVLQGQGGDELFWGYPWVRQAMHDSLRKSALAEKGRSTLSDYLELNAPERWSCTGLWNWATTLAGLRTGWDGFRRDQTNPREQMVFYDLTPDFRIACNEVQALYTSDFAERVNSSRAAGLFTFPLPWPPLDVRLTRLVCQTYLLENGIAQADRLSMAASVELRLPLVDYKLVETVIGLRKTHTDYNLPPKTWFKRALQPVLPDWVVNRPKRGFMPPVRRWHDALFAAYGNQLDGGYLVTAGILSPGSGRQLAAGPFPRRAIVPLSFKALVLELWCRQFATRLNCH
jgi:asparagine synthase (glutamine-hydrolysing)